MRPKAQNHAQNIQEINIFEHKICPFITQKTSKPKTASGILHAQISLENIRFSVLFLDHISGASGLHFGTLLEPETEPGLKIKSENWITFRPPF